MLGSAWKHDLEELLAGSDLCHEIGESIPAASERLNLFAKVILVLRVCLAANTVGIQIAHQTIGNARAIVQILAETLGALELHSVNSCTDINRRAILRCPQLSHAIKMLESKARRVGATMANSASGVLHVLEQPGAHRAFGAVLNSGEIHIGGRVRRRLAHEDFVHLYAALGGRGCTRMSQER